ncbi:MAG: hypothetical protein LBF91_01095 [Azoarcus sp.]|jgi:hypothetical protein|nr:hypothetical protein [Azoarcus sp.]
MNIFNNMALVGLLSVTCASSLALASPQFNIRAYCRQVGDVVGGSAMIEATCREQEAEALREIGRMRASARAMRYCTEVAKVTGGSYQILQSCLEQETTAEQQLD